MLNKQGPNRIDWTNFSWNPIKGVCKHDCDYCYMKRIQDRFKHNPEVRLAEKTLNCKLPKEPCRIFVGSNHDIFGEWIPKEWIDWIIHRTIDDQQITFQFLTKNPKRYEEFTFPDNCWLGTTIDTQKRADQNPRLMSGIKNLQFISFEPLLEEIELDLRDVGWVIIGANSNPGAEKPKKEWPDKLIAQARQHNIPVWMKDNFGYPERIKEFPQERLALKR